MEYRNVNAIISIQGIEVDEGSLWREVIDFPGVLRLVDDDQYVTVNRDDHEFEKV